MRLSDEGLRASSPSRIARIARQAALARARDPDGICDLAAGSPCLFEEAERLWRRLLSELVADEGLGRMIGAYANLGGEPELIEAVRGVWPDRWCSNEAEGVLVGQGATSLVDTALRTFAGTCDNSARRVLLIQSPEYEAYDRFGLPASAFVTVSPRIETTGRHRFRYRVDPEQLSRVDWGSIGVVLLSRPCNPSGAVLADEELECLVGLARPHGVPVVIDGVYGAPFPDLVYDRLSLDEAEPDGAWRENVLTIVSLSKAGLPGERIGIAVGAERILEPMREVQIGKSLMTSKLGQVLAARAISRGDLGEIVRATIKPHYQSRLTMIGDLLEEHIDPAVEYYVHEADGGLFRWMWLPGIDDQDLCEELMRDGVFVMPGRSFFIGAQKGDSRHHRECVRLSCTAPEQELRRGIRSLGKVLHEWRGGGSKREGEA